MRQSQSSNLKAGDHIYTDGSIYLQEPLYYHHGIYVGDGMVIHFLRSGKKMSPSSGSSSPCPKRGYTSELNCGIVKTCMDCFLDGKPLYIFQYEASFLKASVSIFCSVMCSRPPKEVVKTATSLLEQRSFGDYNVCSNNCEHFASFCKTGKRRCRQIDRAIISLAKGAYTIYKHLTSEQDDDTDKLIDSLAKQDNNPNKWNDSIKGKEPRNGLHISISEDEWREIQRTSDTFTSLNKLKPTKLNW